MSGTVPCEACNGEGYEIEVPTVPPRDDPYYYRVTNRKCEACNGTGKQKTCPICGCSEIRADTTLSCECPAPSPSPSDTETRHGG